MESATETPDDLSGQLLIAMPGMGGDPPRFEKSVVFLCAHSAEGAMGGLIVNKPTPDLALDDLLEQLDIDKGAGSAGVGVFFGGPPVETGRGSSCTAGTITGRLRPCRWMRRFR